MLLGKTKTPDSGAIVDVYKHSYRANFEHSCARYRTGLVTSNLVDFLS